MNRFLSLHVDAYLKWWISSDLPQYVEQNKNSIAPARQREYVEALADCGIAREAAARIGCRSRRFADSSVQTIFFKSVADSRPRQPLRATP